LKQEIKKFLANPAPEVISLTGRWGVGKTYAWRTYLEEARKEKRIGQSRYSYVSLFGVNSLEQLKQAIFENTVTSELAGVQPTLATVQDNLSQMGMLGARKLLNSVLSLPPIKTYTGDIFSSAWFLSVRETIVCIDDIERRGKGLEARQLLGLVSSLKENRNCKVLMIWNDDTDDAEKGEFNKYHEKVVDRSLRFDPTPIEAVEIAIVKNTNAARWLAEDCISLGLKNIRLIKHIERPVRELEILLSKFDPDVLRTSVHSFALLSWCRQDPDNAPPLEFLRHKRGVFDYEQQDTSTTIEPPAEPKPNSEGSWNALLDSYKFDQMDEIDVVLLDGVMNGYFDESRLSACARNMDETIKANRADNSFAESWDIYHDSFDDNQEEMLNKMYESTIRGMARLSVTSLNSTVTLFKALGRTEQAKQMIAQFVEKRSGDWKTFDLQMFPFGDMVTDPDIIGVFSSKLAAFTVKKNAGEILIGIGQTSSWNSEDIKTLASCTVDEFYHLLKSARSQNLRLILKASLMFDNMTGTSTDMVEFSNRVKEALKLIGNESPLNAIRVKRYGVIVDSPATGQANEI
jgi:hypothetical protein